jgi:pimeloyl-ACP methyl ester carboxylesterase
MLTRDTGDARHSPRRSGSYPAYTPPPAPFEDIYFTVALEGLADGPLPDHGFSCHARRWHSPKRADGLRVLMVPGIGHNFNFFAPLAATLLDPLGGFVEGVSEVYAVDLPGHGGSQSPPNIKFGLLTLDHYVSALRQALAALKGRGRGPLDIISGHSMGGLLTMLLEQSFVSDGTTLEEAHGTRGVVLLAPAIPEEVPWSLTTGPFDAGGPASPALAILTPFVNASAAYGPFVYASDEDYLNTFFGIEGGLAAGSPSLVEAGALNGMESYAAGSELAGIDLEERSAFERPHVRHALFSRYAFGLACYSEDFLFKPEEEATLGIYLYGAGEGWTFLPVTNRDAVHNSPYSQPARTSKVFADVVAEMERRAATPG